MGHFVKTKKTFNAYIDRLVNLDFDDADEMLRAEEHLNDNLAGQSLDLMNSLKSPKLH